MKKKFGADTMAGIITVIVGLFFLIMTAIDPKMTFGIGSDFAPGPGFYPYILSSLIVIFGIALIVRGIKIAGIKEYFEMNTERKSNISMMVKLIIGLVVFLAVWKMLAPNFGDIVFYIGVFLFEIFMNKIFERSWKFTILYALIFTAFVFVVFNLGFKISFNA